MVVRVAPSGGRGTGPAPRSKSAATTATSRSAAGTFSESMRTGVCTGWHREVKMW